MIEDELTFPVAGKIPVVIYKNKSNICTNLVFKESFIYGSNAVSHKSSQNLLFLYRLAVQMLHRVHLLNELFVDELAELLLMLEMLDLQCFALSWFLDLWQES